MFLCNLLFDSLTDLQSSQTVVDTVHIQSGFDSLTDLQSSQTDVEYDVLVAPFDSLTDLQSSQTDSGTHGDHRSLIPLLIYKALKQLQQTCGSVAGLIPLLIYKALKHDCLIGRRLEV